MNKLEANALRIAELMGYKPFGERIDGLPMGYTLNNSSWATCDIIPKFIDYNGLMPIVFECNYVQDDLDIEIVIYGSGLDVHLDDEDILITMFDTKEGFIEALQLACIKYLELKK